jgi:hypothetical protein
MIVMVMVVVVVVMMMMKAVPVKMNLPSTCSTGLLRSTYVYPNSSTFHSATYLTSFISGFMATSSTI